MNAMVLVKNLIGGDEVVAAATEVERIRREGAAAAQEADRLERAKLDAPEFDEVEKINHAIAKQRWLIAQRANQLAKAEARLKDVRAAVRAARWREHRKLDDARFERAIIAYSKAFEAWNGLKAGRAAMQAEGFADELRVLTRLPNLNGNPFIAPDLIQMALAEAARSNPRLAKIEFPTGTHERMTLQSAAESLGHRPASGWDGHTGFGPQGSVSTVTLGPPPSMKPSKPLTAPKAGPDKSKPSQVPDDWSPLGEGEVRAVVIRAGFCATDTSLPCRPGQVIKIDEKSSLTASRNAAIEILPPEIAPDVDESGGTTTETNA